MAEQQFYSPEEAGEFLGVTRSTVYELLGRGRLRAVKLGRRTLIARESLKAFVAALRTAEILPPGRDRRRGRREAAAAEPRPAPSA